MTTMLHAPCVVDFPSLSSTSFIPSLPYPDDHLSDGWSDEQFLFVAARQSVLWPILSSSPTTRNAKGEPPNHSDEFVLQLQSLMIRLAQSNEATCSSASARF